MNRSELESKHIAELHELAADAGVERYRMLSRAELIAKLADGGRGGERRQRSGRERGPQERRPRERRESKPEGKPAPQAAPRAEAPAQAPERPKRKRRRRRWGRRRRTVRVHDLLLPVGTGRQALVYAADRAGCTALLREVAAALSDAAGGPDPIALLVDPSPEELAEWKRGAPKAEIVSAGRPQHADDALAQARTRAEGGEDVIVLIDSLSRFAESFGDADAARDLFDAGLGLGGGSLTVVAAIERV